MATVKGDVHDIGKNIVGVVLQCNNYEVIDLGVMVSARHDPRDGARAEGRPDRVERAHHAVAVRDGVRGVGAGARGVHSAAPHRRRHHESRRTRRCGSRRPTPSPVVHVQDASRAVAVASSLLSDGAARRVRRRGARRPGAGCGRSTVRRTPPCSGRSPRPAGAAARLDWPSPPPRPAFLGLRAFDGYPLEELVPRIDWTPFFQAWELQGLLSRHPRGSDDRQPRRASC